MNKININENVIEIINDNDEKIIVDKNNIYTIYKDDTVSFMLIYHNKNSGVPLFTSLTSNLEVNGVIYDNIDDLKNSIKNEIESKISFTAEIVDELPSEGENGVIYLIPKEDGGYVEWLWIDGENKFEEIGNTNIDLTNYYDKDEVDNKIDEAITGGDIDLSNYYNKSEVDGLIENVDVDLTNYYDKTEVDTKLNNKVDNSRVLTDVPENAKFTDTVYDDTVVVALINDKADKTTTYTKTEVDGLIGEIEFPETDLSDYYNKNEVDTKLDTKVDNDRVLTDVPENAKFTDTIYDDTLIKADIETKADKVYVDDRFNNLPEENFLKNASYNSETAILTLTMESGDVFDVDLKDLIDVYDDTEIKADIAKKADKTYVDSQDALKADKSSTYTKTEVDGLIENVEVDLSDYYNKGEVDGLIPDISNLATKAELNNKVDNDRVLTDVPENAKFTDTIYDDTAIKADIATKQALLTSVTDIVMVDELPAEPNPNIMYLIEIE